MTELIANLKEINQQVEVLGRDMRNVEDRGRQPYQGRKDRGSRSSSEVTIETWAWYEGSWWLRVERDMNSRQKKKGVESSASSSRTRRQELERWIGEAHEAD